MTPAQLKYIREWEQEDKNIYGKIMWERDAQFVPYETLVILQRSFPEILEDSQRKYIDMWIRLIPTIYIPESN